MNAKRSGGHYLTFFHIYVRYKLKLIGFSEQRAKEVGTSRRVNHSIAFGILIQENSNTKP